MEKILTGSKVNKAVVTFEPKTYHRRFLALNCDRRLGGTWARRVGHMTLFGRASSSSLHCFVYMYHPLAFMCAVREGQGSGGSRDDATDWSESMEVNQPRGTSQCGYMHTQHLPIVTQMNTLPLATDFYNSAF